MNSLDPRVTRLPQVPEETGRHKTALDQFGTFEVFVQPKAGKPFQHEGAVHAPNLEMSFLLAKETFTRRFTCISLCVVDTRHVHASPLTEGGIPVFDALPAVSSGHGTVPVQSYEIYLQPKRGKQHVHAGQVQAPSPAEAMQQAKTLAAGKFACSIWAIATSDFRFTANNELELWLTLPEKKFRDAAEYKGGEKLSEFLERTKNISV